MLYLLCLPLFGVFAITILIKWLEKRRKFVTIVNQTPGPTGKPVIGVLLDFLTPDKAWKVIREFSSKYYPLYKVWWLNTPIYNMVGPEDIEVLFSSTKHTKKSFLYDFLHPWLGTGLLTSSGGKWQSRRKILTPAFHFNILQQFLVVFHEESRRLVEELREECGKTSTNITPIITRYTLHTICETSMGTKLNKKHQTSRTYTESIFKMGQVLLYRMGRPWYLADFIFFFTPTYREQNRLIKLIHSFSKSIIEQRKVNFQEPSVTNAAVATSSSKKRRLAMLDLLISSKNAGEPIDDDGIREEVDTFIFEGHDTTAACISFTLMLLACHQRVQEEVVQELRGVFGDFNRVPTLEDLQSLRHLDRVIKESLRMYPSVSLVSRICEEDFRTPSGYTIPKDSVIHVHIYDVHHNPNIYPDPEKFDPDRFLPENVQHRHTFAYIPFSAGPRNCIGQKFAMLEVKTILAAILRSFVLRPIDTPASITMIAHLITRTLDGIRVKFEKRNW